MASYVGLVLGAVGVIIFTALWRTLVALTWKPYIITKKFKKQGVSGPAYKFWSGNLKEIAMLKEAAKSIEMETNSHDIAARVTPHHYKWINEYGGTFLYWIGTDQRLCITDPEIVREVLSNKSGFYPKNKPLASVITLLGKGLAMSEGDYWARHRKVVSPAFAVDKLKVMTKEMADCTVTMLDKWQQRVDENGGKQVEVEGNKEFEEVTADAICHAGFGTSYAEGKEVFLAQKQLLRLILANFLKLQIPIFNFLPTKFNFEKWELDRRMKATLRKIIEKRYNSSESSYGEDLLGLMIDSSMKQQGNEGLTINEIVDECKTFFIAGHETTSHLLTWTAFLLSTNPEWQERLREEVLQECGKEIPTAENLNKFKYVHMVLLEALRLYSPVLMLLRRATKDMKLGNLLIPEGTQLTVPFIPVHRDKELWGPDANEFNPLRFENGVTKAAKHPNALLAFSMGPRSCIGQNFALFEAKTVVSMVLQRFSFTLKEGYKHRPADILTLQPQDGLPLIIKPLAA